MAKKPAQDKICGSNNAVKELRERVVFVNEKLDDISKDYSRSCGVTRINDQQKKNIKLLNKHAAETQKKENEDDGNQIRRTGTI